MTASAQQARRRKSAELSELGGVLRDVTFARVDVRLPRTIAARAVTAWERNDGDAPDEHETVEQRLHRHRAGTLALIGLAISERGRLDGDHVIVALHPEEIGVALSAADDQPQP